MQNSDITTESPRGLAKAVRRFFLDAVIVGLRHPRFLIFTARIFLNQIRFSKIRRKNKKINPPPFMIFSITDQCNLHCKGCYAMALHHGGHVDLKTDLLSRVLGEAQELGTAVVMIAGGEPLSRKDLFEITRRFPEMLFPVFTNGLLIDDAMAAVLQSQPQCVPIVSIEGNGQETDQRRGSGVFLRVTKAISRLAAAGIFYGISVTVTRSNFASVTSSDFIRSYVRLGCLLFFFVEYVPVEKNTDSLTLTDGQRIAMTRLSKQLQSKFSALFIAFPGDEDRFGGCLAAGRGFVHVNHRGDLEPCPFAPYTDVNLAGTTLREALSSPLLRKIRDNHHLLGETKGGCALWDKKELVAELVKTGNDHGTDCR